MTADRRILDRITYTPGPQTLAPIPWPDGMAPVPAPRSGERPAKDAPLPKADVVVVTYTAAEKQSLASVLTPGVSYDAWNYYAHNWATFEPLLGPDAPARYSKMLGAWWTATGRNGLNVLLLGSDLHPDIDGPKLPFLPFIRQVAAEAQPSLLITTGTAGAVNLGAQLGDVAVATEVYWDCEKQFAGQPWAHTGYPTSPLSPAQRAALAGIGPLLAPNVARLPAEYVTRPAQVWTGPTVSTDFFACGTESDAFGLLATVPGCLTCDMDDAGVGLALSTIESASKWLAVRNCSDPVMPGGESTEQIEEAAGRIYEQWGPTTTAGSAIVSWVLADALCAGQGA